MPGQAMNARELARRSQAAVAAKDRSAWLGLFAPDAVVEDPVGPSPPDPAGAGHHGAAAIAAFYDAVIGPAERIAFEIERSYLCGDEIADVGVICTTLRAAGRSPWYKASTPTAATARASWLRCAPSGSTTPSSWRTAKWPRPLIRQGSAAGAGRGTGAPFSSGRGLRRRGPGPGGVAVLSVAAGGMAACPGTGSRTPQRWPTSPGDYGQPGSRSPHREDLVRPPRNLRRGALRPGPMRPA
jgi:steroid Delta-isomerase